MSIYKKTDSGAARLDNDLSLAWIKLGELAGNGSKTKTITVIDTSQYHELLLTCGPAIEYQTGQILASTIIPIPSNTRLRFACLRASKSLADSISSSSL